MHCEDAQIPQNQPKRGRSEARRRAGLSAGTVGETLTVLTVRRGKKLLVMLSVKGTHLEVTPLNFTG